MKGGGGGALDNLFNFISLWMAASSRCISHMLNIGLYSRTHICTRVHGMFLLYEEHRIKEEAVKACQEYLISLVLLLD